VLRGFDDDNNILVFNIILMYQQAENAAQQIVFRFDSHRIMKYEICYSKKCRFL